MNDDFLLRDALSEWKVDVPVSPRFNAAVWARIREREEAASSGLTGWILAVFRGAPLWRLAMTSSVALALVGIVLGSVTAVTANERQRAELERRYLRSVDPYLQVAHTLAR